MDPQRQNRNDRSGFVKAVQLALLLCAMSTASNAQVQRTTYRGWESLRLKNEFIRLDFTPQLGGRILGYQLGGHSFLWSNPRLQGQSPPPSHLAPDGSWLNWGGDKLWPAPQGWDNSDQWPGPPDPILDGSPQKTKTAKCGDEGEGIQVTSPPDAKTGIQFSRVICLTPASSRVHVIATMTNVVHRPVRWGIWTVTQLDAGNSHGPGWNSAWNTYVPLNPNSHFPRGFQILYGSESNPEIHPRAIPGIFQLQYKWIVGKVGLDSTGGWLANVDGSTGYLFVQKFSYVSAATYPDGSSVEVWTNGIGTIKAWGRMVHMQTDPSENPYIVESELLGPLVRLAPAERTTFAYDWYSANIGGDFPILSCKDYGCICQQVTAHRVASRLQLQGRLGIFYQGHLEIELADAHGRLLESHVLNGSVSPLAPVILDAISIPAPPSATAIRLVLYNTGRKRVGELARTEISQQ